MKEGGKTGWKEGKKMEVKIENVKEGLTLGLLGLPFLFLFFLNFPSSSWCLAECTAPNFKLVGAPTEGCVNDFHY